MSREGESDDDGSGESPVRRSGTRVGRAPSEPSIGNDPTSQPEAPSQRPTPGFGRLQPPRFVDPDRAGPDRAGPDRAGPDRAGPDRAGPDRAEPGYEATATPNTSGSNDLVSLPDVDRDLYSVGFEIARGGMGRIFAARDRKLRRDIVLKTLTEGGHVPRFEREALITARLQHPSIVRVYDAGRLAGDPFYAMEYVRGKSLDKVVATKEDPAARLALLPHVIAIADALAYAHSEGVIHRDLKPANVLVGSFGETVVIDWGLAKDLRRDDPDSIDPDRPPAPVGALGAADMTVAGAVMGTPSYMPPEQARGERADERSDVYAIGAILYYVLSGTPPTSGMTALEDARAGGITPLRERAPETPEELITIVEHAMAFSPDDRYHSARDLADDLKRFAAGQLVARHTYSTGSLIARWLRRHRAAVGVAAAIVLVVGGLSTMYIRGLASQRDAARDELVTTREVLDKTETATDDLALKQAERALPTDPTLAIAWLQRLSERGLARPKAAELANDAASRGIAFELAGPRATIRSLLFAQPLGTAYVTGDDGALYRFQLGAFAADNLGSHDKPVTALAASSDGFWLATGGADDQVKIWDLEQVQGHPGAKHVGGVRGLAFSPDGNTVASSGGDGTVIVWTVLKNEGRVVFKEAAGPLAYSSDGKLVIARRNGTLVTLDPAGKLAEVGRNYGSITALATSPSGKTIAAGTESGLVVTWSVGDPKPIEDAHQTQAIRNLAFATEAIVVGATAQTIGVHSLADHGFANVDSGFPITSITASATSIAAACGDGKVRMWPLDSKPAERSVRLLLGHRAPVTAVAFSTDGKKLLSAADDRLRLWPLEPAPTAPTGPALGSWLAARTNVTVAK